MIGVLPVLGRQACRDGLRRFFVQPYSCSSRLNTKYFFLTIHYTCTVFKFLCPHRPAVLGHLSISMCLWVTQSWHRFSSPFPYLELENWQFPLVRNKRKNKMSNVWELVMFVHLLLSNSLNYQEALWNPTGSSCPAASWWSLQLLLYGKCTQPSVMSYVTQGRHGLVL
jgi:hypothetical protein